MATSNYRTIQTNFTEGVQFVKNYIPNATFNNGSVNNWSKCTAPIIGGVLSTTSIVDFTAPSITTFTATNSTPISGSYSMQVGGTWARGEGIISDAFTIEREDLGKPLTFSFSYEAITNPLNANWSGILGSQTFAVYIYDETAAAGQIKWIQPSGFLGMNQNSGVGQVTGNFQSSVVVGQQYRLAIFALQAAGGAITVNFDNFSVGKETSTVGTPVTDYIDYTPTTSWTTGYTISGKFKRIGDSIECIVKLVCTGAPVAASETTFSIPSGYAIDTTKLMSPTVAGTAPTFGDAIGYDISTTNLYLFRCQYWSATTVKLFYQSSSTGQETAVTTALPPTWATNDTIIARFQVPIVGFSSSVQMSNATDTRVVTTSVTGIPPSTTSGSVFIFPTVTYDTHGAYSTSTGRYTVPVSGFIQIAGIIQTTNNNVTFKVYKNGVAGPTFCYITSNTGSGSVTVQCNAGDLLDLRPDNTTGTVLYTGIQFNRLSGPSVVAASETVTASYSITAAASTAINVQFNFNNKIFDSHNAVTTGAGAWKFTAPISGKYEISSSIINATSNNTMSVFKNGSVYRNMGYNIQSVATGASIPGTTIVQLNAGEYIDVRSGSNTVTPTAGVFSGATLSNSNFIDIVRIGN